MSTKPFRALLASELRQSWRSPLPWPLIVAAPAVFILVGQWQAPALERLVQMQEPLALLGLALGAFAAWTWQRGRRNGSDEVLLAWPLPSWQVGLARTLALGTLTLACWLEVTLPSLIYTMVSYATAAQAAGMALPWAQALHDSGLIILSLAASFLGAQALGQLAGALLPGLAALVLLILYRAIALFAPRLAAGILQWPYGLLATPEFIWGGNSRLAAGLQAHLYTGLFLAQQGFWVLGSLGMLTLLILLFRSRRDARQLRGKLLAGAALLVTVGAAAPFIAVEHGFVAAQWRAIAEYGEAVKPSLRLSEAPAPREPAPSTPVAVPVGYDLAVDLTRPPLAQVQATVGLQAPADAPLDALTLTLRRCFEVDAVSLDGAAAPFERQNDLLRIPLPAPLAPGQAVTVTIAYHGNVADWRLDPYETPAALASTGLVLLPAGWGWYPLPGEQRLTWEIGMSSAVFRALADRTQPFNDAEPLFDVTVRAPSAITDLTGFTQQSGGSWRLAAKRNRVNLLGGPWWKRMQGAIEYAVPLEELDTWRAGSADLQRLLAAAQDWTGVAPIAVVPSPVGLATLDDAGLLDETGFGLIEPGAGRDCALMRFEQWLRLSLSLPAGDFSVWTQAGYTGDEIAALRALASTRIVTDAYGSDAAASLPPAGQAPPDTLVAAWAARTPAAAQKEALRRLVHIAQLRPLAPADLAFLKDGGGQP